MIDLKEKFDKWFSELIEAADADKNKMAPSIEYIAMAAFIDGYGMGREETIVAISELERQKEADKPSGDKGSETKLIMPKGGLEY